MDVIGAAKFKGHSSRWRMNPHLYLGTVPRRLPAGDEFVQGNHTRRPTPHRASTVEHRNA
jgi:hypothetical protein